MVYVNTAGGVRDWVGGSRRVSPTVGLCLRRPVVSGVCAQWPTGERREGGGAVYDVRNAQPPVPVILSIRTFRRWTRSIRKEAVGLWSVRRAAGECTESRGMRGRRRGREGLILCPGDFRWKDPNGVTSLFLCGGWLA